MASDTPPTPNSVARSFVDLYYHLLHHTPELVHKFYHDSSVLSRPDPDGLMTSVTTMEGINQKIISFAYKEYKAEIKTADAQKSYKDGVTLLVTGCLTDKGFFVLNDVFRYVEDGEVSENHQVDNVKTAPDLRHVNDENLLINEETEVVETQSQLHDNDVLVEDESTTSLDDGILKSYASIVKVIQEGLRLTQVYVPTETVKVAPKKTETQSHGQPVSAHAPVPEALAQSNSSTPESSKDDEDVEEHSIYIRYLPYSVTAMQVEAEFKKFGSIKPGGVQVRNNRQQGYCFGFVEYEFLSSVESAIKASPITIGGRQAVIEIKRTSSRGGSSARGGRPPIGRGGPWSERFRERGNYGGRSSSRNEYFNQCSQEFFSRGRGSVGRSSEGYQGRGRSSRTNGPRYNAFNST